MEKNQLTVEDLKKYLESVANKPLVSDQDDFCPMESSGGNFDDAYSQGANDGEISFARSMLKKFW